MFGFGKKKETVQPVQPSINIKEKIEIHSKALEIVIKEKKLIANTARIVLVMDCSGSMQGLFSNGTVQDTVERTMPLALKFDDDGEIETYIFSNGVIEIKTPATIHNIEGYVNNFVKPKIQWGGTCYAPAIKAIVNDYTGKNATKDPTFVVFVTDGDNADKTETTSAIIEASKYNIFWKFVGIGNASKNYLEELNNKRYMSGRVIDNTDFFDALNIKSLSDNDLYTKLLEEYDDWQVKAKQLNIL
jgi:uncharacterized protein with von Willebrand factor type A (vWA) domain